MVAIPAGTFIMGSPRGEPHRGSDEGPRRRVTIARPFAIGQFEVTFADWDACRAARGCGRRPSDNGWGRGRRPVINVSFNDIQIYLIWLSKVTGKRYRLPSEAEWEYAARAGTTTAYWWGQAIGANHAVCRSCGSRWDNRSTAPAGSFPPNPWGLFDTSGNVWEWVTDCYRDSYRGVPSNGRPLIGGSNCQFRVVRGGSWTRVPDRLRSANRLRRYATTRENYQGFRVARDLP
jgi:formylglycine-generating enzyme required for sulfatase activity